MQTNDEQKENKIDLEIVYFTSPNCLLCREQEPIFWLVPKEYNPRMVDVTTKDWLMEAVANFIQATPSIMIQYEYEASPWVMWYIVETFKGLTKLKEIIDYIEYGRKK